MIGAIAGDIFGSIYEHHPIKTTEFQLLAAGPVMRRVLLQRFAHRYDPAPQ